MTGLLDRLGAWAEDARGRSALVVPVAIAGASRVFSIALIALANAGSSPSTQNPFVAWDGRWYVSIAERGYHAAPQFSTAALPHYDFAFFPLWPLVIRFATFGVFDAELVAVVLANLLFVLGAVLVWRLIAQRLPRSVATGTVVLLSFCPPAFVFSLAYSEPLFLVISASCFLSAAHPARHGILAALAMLTRIAGAAIVASAAMTFLGTRGRERRAAFLVVACGTAAFAGWCLFIAVLVNDPLGFLHGSPSFNNQSGLVQILRTMRSLKPRYLVALAFVLIALGGALLMLRRDRELGVFAVAVVALSLLPGGVIWSMPRYCLAAFPAFAGLADRLGPRGTVLLAVAFGIAQCFFVNWSFVAPNASAP